MFSNREWDDYVKLKVKTFRLILSAQDSWALYQLPQNSKALQIVSTMLVVIAQQYPRHPLVHQ